MKSNRLTRPWFRSLLVAAAIVAAPTMSSCVDDVGLIDRTSPDKIDKRLFEGVWLYVQTTVDVPFSSAVSFTGEMNFGESQKVVFDIQEGWLIAHSVVETVSGSEAEWKTHSVRKYWDPDNRDKFVELYLGPPVARWQITSHYDVIRQYNSYNGAQTNEVVENTTDRPWYERDYIRVEWHQQGVRPFFYSLGGGVGSESYFVGEDKPESPDAMTLDSEGGYLDYVVRTVAWSAGQSRCSTYGLSAYDCSKTEVKVRHSFKRLDHTRDYEPLRYHNNEHQELFGFFLTERNTYDVDWGSTYEGKVSFANRWNLWLDNFDYLKPVDAEGVEMDVACFTDKECNRDAGERCQKTTGWFAEGYCAVPVAKSYAERTQKPIIYHLNTTWHPDYLDEAYNAADNWSDVFKDSVAWQLFYEKEGIGSTRGCTAHSDCSSDALLTDLEIPVQYPGLACHGTEECQGNLCAADGFCAAERACDENSPCAIGQTCSNGKCQQGGQTVVERLATTTTRGSTVIYHGDGAIVTHDNFSTAKLQAAAGGASYVRFVHADSDGASYGLSITGGGANVQIKGGEFDANRDYDPQDPATADFMALVEPATGVNFEITQNGAPTGFSLRATSLRRPTTWSSSAATSRSSWARASRRAATACASFTRRPVRLPSTSALRGVRLEETIRNESAGQYQFQRTVAYPYGRATSYTRDAGDLQRATVTVAGSRGDVTCFESDGIGRCVGWPKDITDADKQWVADKKAALPDLFVLCENQYNELSATDQSKIDAREGDARYTYEKDGAAYNPCGDPKLVAKPEGLKKIGDIRYSFFYWVNEQQRSGPLGYGPSAADPDTGEIITATANIYGGAIHTYSTYAATSFAWSTATSTPRRSSSVSTSASTWRPAGTTRCPTPRRSSRVSVRPTGTRTTPLAGP